MSRRKRQIVGKIGYCDNRTLGIRDINGKPLEGGHYVYIRKLNDDNSCNVNVITSLESSPGIYNFVRIRKIRQGYLYPIPKNDATFSRWSAVDLSGNVKKVKVSKIKNIGCKRMKNRHKWFVGKFCK